MITIAVPAEGDKSEQRVALSPETAKKFTALGCKVRVQAGAGAGVKARAVEMAGPDRPHGPCRSLSAG